MTNPLPPVVIDLNASQCREAFASALDHQFKRNTHLQAAAKRALEVVQVDWTSVDKPMSFKTHELAVILGQTHETVLRKARKYLQETKQPLIETLYEAKTGLKPTVVLTESQAAAICGLVDPAFVEALHAITTLMRRVASVAVESELKTRLAFARQTTQLALAHEREAKAAAKEEKYRMLEEYQSLTSTSPSLWKRIAEFDFSVTNNTQVIRWLVTTLRAQYCAMVSYGNRAEHFKQQYLATLEDLILAGVEVPKISTLYLTKEDMNHLDSIRPGMEWLPENLDTPPARSVFAPEIDIDTLHERAVHCEPHYWDCVTDPEFNRNTPYESVDQTQPEAHQLQA